MSTYEPPEDTSLDGDDEGNSIASSIEAPPFALAQDDYTRPDTEHSRHQVAQEVHNQTLSISLRIKKLPDLIHGLP